MLTLEDDVEIHALARRGWSVSAIARHTGRDRKTVTSTGLSSSARSLSSGSTAPT
jgi:transposase